MPLTSFCGLLTLQVGVAVLSAVFFTLAAVILAANLFNYSMNYGSTWPLNLTLLIIFVIGLIIAALLMFASSYGETRSLAMVSLVVILILTCYWVILSCFSFASNLTHVRAVCIHNRCPETLWLADLDYRNYTANGTFPSYDNVDQDNMYRDDLYPSDYQNYYAAKNEDRRRTSHNYHFVGAVILFIINLLFFLFSAFVLWSWASELDWADYYIEDEPVVVYEEDPYY